MATTLIAACPLCGSSKMNSSRTLYGHSICKKCWGSFANRRQFAFIIDIILFRATLFLLGVIMGMLMLNANSTLEDIEGVDGIVTLLGYLLLVVFLSKDGFGGYSPGKYLLGVHAVDAKTGRGIVLGASFKRNLPMLIPFIPLVMGFQLGNGHRWGDGWTNTRVVWDRYAGHPIFTGAAVAQVEPEDFSQQANVPPPTMTEEESRNPFTPPKTET